MNLKKYDNKYIKITTNEDEDYEGICTFNDYEYNEHEYGRNEESLQILNIIFYKSFIKSIEALKVDKGNIKFSEKYGNLERLIIESGIDFIEDVFETEETEHIYRLVLCLKEYINKYDKNEKEQIFKLLEKLLQYNNDAKLVKEVRDIINNYSR